MLVLYETPAGYALFKVTDDAKVKKADAVWGNLDTADKASSL